MQSSSSSFRFAPTVYATFGSKGAIVRALLARMEDEPDPHRKLGAFAQWSRALFSTSKALIAVAHGAASDPAIVELRERATDIAATRCDGSCPRWLRPVR